MRIKELKLEAFKASSLDNDWCDVYTFNVSPFHIGGTLQFHRAEQARQVEFYDMIPLSWLAVNYPDREVYYWEKNDELDGLGVFLTICTKPF